MSLVLWSQSWKVKEIWLSCLFYWFMALPIHSRISFDTLQSVFLGRWCVTRNRLVWHKVTSECLALVNYCIQINSQNPDLPRNNEGFFTMTRYSPPYSSVCYRQFLLQHWQKPRTRQFNNISSTHRSLPMFSPVEWHPRVNKPRILKSAELLCCIYLENWWDIWMTTVWWLTWGYLWS